jgi:uncharacterized protein YdcH (DUF465 family)
MTDNVVDFDIRLLRKRHKELDSMIWELEGQDLAETHVRLTELKKEKLHLKDKIAFMEKTG